MNKLGKFGIKGNTGLGVAGAFHLSAPYDSNGQVFVDCRDRGWERVDADKANPDAIIRCCMCDKPAVSLDHLYPYHSEMNRCARHFKTRYQESLDKRFIKRIRSAAIRYKGIIYPGRSHYEIGCKMVDDLVCPRPYPSGKNQGFVTEDGEFVSREEALKIALKAGQVDADFHQDSKMLFSEDLRRAKRNIT